MNETFSMKTDGFHAELFRPGQDKYPGKVLICFSGSDGKFELTRRLAATFQFHGLTALALTAGSLLPGLVNAAVAVAPISTVCQGFTKKKGFRLLPGGSWSFHGEEIPYTSFGLKKFP